MKTSKGTLGLTSFLLGAGLGITVLALISFSATSPPLPMIKTGQISVDSATHMSGNYFKSADVISAKPEAVVIDTTQVRVMYTIMMRDHSLAGFRIYFGNPSPLSKEKIGIVVGMDNKEHDVLSTIYQTAGGHVGPCPNVCDVTSPIHHQ